ncbi:hypothetical protein VTK73DRAFT_6081 [Phialemonium thermophilum]|uniref:Uncharacterized protein n=1 Tax=Phialemonium thermophilum TaxID=223376 RepID=A0ABR3WKK3_9PEZI
MQRTTASRGTLVDWEVRTLWRWAGARSTGQEGGRESRIRDLSQVQPLLFGEKAGNVDDERRPRHQLDLVRRVLADKGLGSPGSGEPQSDPQESREPYAGPRQGRTAK